MTHPSTNEAPAASWPEPTDDHPTDEQVELWVYDSIVEATDGCCVEPDGVCEHGHPSWLIYLGYV